jgi:hypothetical protein
MSPIPSHTPLRVRFKAKHGTSVMRNGGDCVESCTALVEDEHERLSLLRWTEQIEVPSGAWTPPRAPAQVHAA